MKNKSMFTTIKSIGTTIKSIGTTIKSIITTIKFMFTTMVKGMNHLRLLLNLDFPADHAFYAF